MQCEFSRRVAKLLTWLDANGYEVTLGECKRPPEAALYYSREKKGILHSNHIHSLAIDLNLFRDGKYLTEKTAYAPAGEYWESLSVPDCESCWGGKFETPDSDHFSLKYGEVK